MTDHVRKIKNVLGEWRGEDDAGRRSALEVAEEIDRLYAEYLRGLPAETRAIQLGQEAQELRVA